MFPLRSLRNSFGVGCRLFSQKTKINEVNFGYETVTEVEKDRRVYEVFHNVASSYDLMNDVMSLGIHRIWKDIFVETLGPTPGTDLLDVAGGTGDIAFRVLKYLNNAKPIDERQSSVTVLDINKEMLKYGQERATQLGYSNIQWVLGNAEELPFEENSFSAYVIAFGIRNVTRIPKALKEAYRVLKPGGRFLCLEFSQVQNDALSWIYDKYSFNVIPPLGQVLVGDWKSYQYLIESIRKFPNQENFKILIEEAGFQNVSYENLTFGIVSIHSGFKF